MNGRPYNAMTVGTSDSVNAICDTSTGKVFRCLTGDFELGDVVRGVPFSKEAWGDWMGADVAYSRILRPADPRELAQAQKGLKRCASPRRRVTFARGVWYEVIEE